METLLYGCLALSFILMLITLYKTKDLLNPSLISFIFWGIPIFLSSLRWSDLQAEKWEDITYLLLIYSLLAFVIIPSLIILFLKIKFVNRTTEIKKLSENINPQIIVFFSFLTIVLYFVENIISGGTLIPALHSNSGVDVHTISISGLLIITRSFIPVLALFLALLYFSSKKKMYLLLLILCILLPVTRLARFDILMALLPLIGVVFEFIKNKKKFMLITLVLCIVISLGGAALGQYRMTHGNKYDISYSQGIMYKGIEGPYEVGAVIYGYFALSIENLDRFVKSNYDFDDYQYGKFILRPITAGVFKFNNIFNDYPMYEFINDLRDPLIGYATVHTAMVDFSMDFGYYLSFFVMLLFSFIGLLFYIQSQKNFKRRIYFLIYSQGFLFLSFQNLFIEARLLYQIILVAVLLTIAINRNKKQIHH
jgi:oligosaccharide repeat unit polymerase